MRPFHNRDRLDRQQERRRGPPDCRRTERGDHEERFVGVKFVTDAFELSNDPEPKERGGTEHHIVGAPLSCQSFSLARNGRASRRAGRAGTLALAAESPSLPEPTRAATPTATAMRTTANDVMKDRNTPIVADIRFPFPGQP